MKGNSGTRSVDKTHRKGVDYDNYVNRTAQVLSSYGIDVTSSNVRNNLDGSTSVEIKAVKDGKQVAFIRREFSKNSDGELEVNHQHFILSDEYQGQGLAKKMLADNLEQYQKAGVRYIRLRASESVGGYAWARYGFYTDRGTALDMAVDSGNSEVFKVFKQFYSSHSENEPFPMKLYANQSWGKKLLLGKTWYGFIDLKNKEHVKYLRSKL